MIVAIINCWKIGNYLMLFQREASGLKSFRRSVDRLKFFVWWRSRREHRRALLKLPICCCLW